MPVQYWQGLRAMLIGNLRPDHGTDANPGHVYQQLDRNASKCINTRAVEVLPELSQDGNIRCVLTPLSIAKQGVQRKQRYVALSYVWGLADECYSIELNGRLHNVRRNLYEFLSDVQANVSSQPQTKYWIDALCINQHDIHERNHQVKNTGLIYSQASRVRVWLGFEANEWNTFLRIFRNLSRDWQTTRWSPDLLDRPCRELSWSKQKWFDILENLTRHKYWSCAWTQQEFVLGLTIGLGTQDAYIDNFELRDLVEIYEDQNGYRGFSSRSIKSLLRQRRTSNQTEIILKEPEFLLRRSTVHRLQCSDVKDRMFSQLSLVKNGASFHIDYMEDVWILFLRTWIFIAEDNTTQNFDKMMSRFSLLMTKLELNVDSGWHCFDCTEPEGDNAVPEDVSAKIRNTVIKIDLFPTNSRGVQVWSSEDTCHTYCRYCSQYVRSFKRPPELACYCCVADAKGVSFHLSFAPKSLPSQDPKALRQVYFHSRVAYGLFTQESTVYAGRPDAISDEYIGKIRDPDCIKLDVFTCFRLILLCIRLERFETGPRRGTMACSGCFWESFGRRAVHYKILFENLDLCIDELPQRSRTHNFYLLVKRAILTSLKGWRS